VLALEGVWTTFMPLSPKGASLRDVCDRGVCGFEGSSRAFSRTGLGDDSGDMCVGCSRNVAGIRLQRECDAAGTGTIRFSRPRRILLKRLGDCGQMMVQLFVGLELSVRGGCNPEFRYAEWWPCNPRQFNRREIFERCRNDSHRWAGFRQGRRTTRLDSETEEEWDGRWV
jgi:hypothetical protein